ncbi:MAG: glutamate--tRNA ligase family protein, partial [Brevundimonas sp.]
GLSWDGPVRRQSEHRADYDAALQRLRDMGVLYRCFRTRKELMALAGVAPHADDPKDALAFAGGPIDPAEEAERLAQGQAFAWRLSLAAAKVRLGGFDDLSWVEEGENAGIRTVRPEALGDMVLGRKDIGAGYVIASVVDDAAQGVSHVIRGVDLVETTSIQRVLQALLDLPTPTYRHHRLLRAPDGKRLSKRDKAESLASLRGAGVTPNDLRREFFG